jgi:Family of unknown function (DUF6510)
VRTRAVAIPAFVDVCALVGTFSNTKTDTARCGDQNPAGAHRSYDGAGIVLRCPNCDDVALRIAELPDRLVSSSAAHGVSDANGEGAPPPNALPFPRAG